MRRAAIAVLLLSASLAGCLGGERQPAGTESGEGAEPQTTIVAAARP